MKPVDSDYYAVLELKPGSSMEEVKSQYRRLAKRYHPDLNNNDAQCQEKLLRVNAAYAFLSDAARKAAYDARPKPIATPKPPPPASPRTQPSVNATGYYVPVTRQPLTALADIRMTRSGWLGATAVVVLILLGIGLSMDSGDPSRIGRVENVPPAVSANAPDAATGDGSALDSGQPAAPSSTAPAPTASNPIFQPAPGSVPMLPSHRLSSAAEHFRPENAPAVSLPSVLKTPISPKYPAPLPRVDGLIRHGDALSGSGPAYAGSQTNDAAHRALRAQTAADLADLQATRRRIKPAVVRLSRQRSPEAGPRDTEPIWTGIHPLEDRRESVRGGHPMLSANPTSRPTPALAATPPPALHAAPSRPFIASTVTSVSVKTADKPAPKPKAPEPAAPSFITWGK
ncbi:MAG: DnaJ domain-containing protein [Armatimonadota bacterium]|nr:DnaJ domain-containing protein [Armatimonadota bacterium]